jgi:hypothetical protein
MLLNAGINPNLFPMPNNPKHTLVFLFHAKRKWSKKGPFDFPNVQKAERFIHKNIVIGAVQTSLKKQEITRFRKVATDFNTLAAISEHYIHIIDMATTEYVVPPFRAMIQRTTGDYLTNIQITFNGPLSVQKKQELNFDQNARLCMYDIHVSGMIEYITEKWIPFLQHIRVYDVDDFTDARIPAHGIELVTSYLPHDSYLLTFTRSVPSFHYEAETEVLVVHYEQNRQAFLIFKKLKLIGTINTTPVDGVFSFAMDTLLTSQYESKTVRLTNVTHEAITSLENYSTSENQVLEMCFVTVSTNRRAHSSDIIYERIRIHIANDEIKMITELPHYQMSDMSRTCSVSRDNSTMIERDSAGITMIMYDMDQNEKTNPKPWIDRDLSYQHTGVHIYHNMVVFTTQDDVQLMVCNVPKRKREMVRSLPMSMLKLSNDQLKQHFALAKVRSIAEVTWRFYQSKMYHIANSGVCIVTVEQKAEFESPQIDTNPYCSVSFIF